MKYLEKVESGFCHSPSLGYFFHQGLRMLQRASALFSNLFWNFGKLFKVPSQWKRKKLKFTLRRRRSGTGLI